MVFRHRMVAVVVPSIAALGLCLMTAGNAAAKQRLEVTYMKSSEDSVDWIGVGEANGEPVEIAAFWPLDGRRETGRVTRVSDFLFTVIFSDESFFVIDMDGIINGANGKIIFNGEVVMSTNPAVPDGTKAKLRARVVDTAPFTTMGSVKLTIP